MHPAWTHEAPPQVCLTLEGESWQLVFQPQWPARALRDLLAVRAVADLPPLRVLRARRQAAGAEPGDWQLWLLADRAAGALQQRRCREAGVLWLEADDLPAALAEHCAALPPTRLVETRARGARFGWVAALALLVGAGLLLLAHGQREQRIAEQNLRAQAAVGALHSPGVAREPVEQLHATLVALGVPALVGERVLVRDAAALDPQRQAELLDQALSPALRAELRDLPALQRYLEQQARRIGQKRLILGGEHCALAGERVLPVPGNRAFVLRLERASAWEPRLHWAGVERIDPQRLHECVALRARP